METAEITKDRAILYDCIGNLDDSYVETHASALIFMIVPYQTTNEMACMDRQFPSGGFRILDRPSLARGLHWPIGDRGQELPYMLPNLWEYRPITDAESN